jgi:hypothetical protein
MDTSLALIGRATPIPTFRASNSKKILVLKVMISSSLASMVESAGSGGEELDVYYEN